MIMIDGEPGIIPIISTLDTAAPDFHTEELALIKGTIPTHGPITEDLEVEDGEEEDGATTTEVTTIEMPWFPVCTIPICFSHLSNFMNSFTKI